MCKSVSRAPYNSARERSSDDEGVGRVNLGHSLINITLQTISYHIPFSNTNNFEQHCSSQWQYGTHIHMIRCQIATSHYSRTAISKNLCYRGSSSIRHPGLRHPFAQDLHHRHQRNGLTMTAILTMIPMQSAGERSRRSSRTSSRSKTP